MWSPDFTLLNFHVWVCTKDVVYECIVNRIEELIHWIFYVERYMNNCDVSLNLYAVLNFECPWFCSWEWAVCSCEVLWWNKSVKYRQKLIRHPLYVCGLLVCGHLLEVLNIWNTNHSIGCVLCVLLLFSYSSWLLLWQATWCCRAVIHLTENIDLEFCHFELLHELCRYCVCVCIFMEGGLGVGRTVVHAHCNLEATTYLLPFSWVRAHCVLRLQ